MRDVDAMIEKLLDMEIVGEDNSITFTDEAKQLIHEISEECLKADVVKDNMEKADEYGKDLSAEDVYVDMLCKIKDALTSIHMRMSARMLIPVIDRKIRKGETGFRHAPAGKEEIDGDPFRWGGFGREFERTAREWQEDGGKEYEKCHICKEPFNPDEHLYCATFKQPEGGMRFRILCKKCAYSFGKVIEP